MSQMCCMSCRGMYGVGMYGGMGIQYRSKDKEGDKKAQQTITQMNAPECIDGNHRCGEWASLGFCTDDDKEFEAFMAKQCCKSCTEVSSKLIERKSPKGKTSAYQAAHKEAIEWKKK